MEGSTLCVQNQQHSAPTERCRTCRYFLRGDDPNALCREGDHARTISALPDDERISATDGKLLNGYLLQQKFDAYLWSVISPGCTLFLYCRTQFQ